MIKSFFLNVRVTFLKDSKVFWSVNLIWDIFEMIGIKNFLKWNNLLIGLLNKYFKNYVNDVKFVITKSFWIYAI